MADSTAAPFRQLDPEAIGRAVFLRLVRGEAEREFDVPRDYPDAFSYLLGVVAGATRTARQNISGYALDELKTLTDRPAPPPEVVYRLLATLSYVPSPNAGATAEPIEGVLVRDGFRRAPSDNRDCHRQALFTLAQHPLPARAWRRLGPLVAGDILDRRYTLAAHAALAAQDPTAADSAVPAVVALLERRGSPPDLFLASVAQRLGTSKDRWANVGRAIAAARPEMPAAARSLLALARAEGGTRDAGEQPGPDADLWAECVNGFLQAMQAADESVVPTGDVNRVLPQVSERDAAFIVEHGLKSARVTKLSAPITVPVVNRAGESVGTVEVDPAKFGGKISKQLLHDVVLMYLANQRAGTHHTLRRGEVAGSTKKLFRQKGTGNARAGTKRTNKRRGGGTAKGPKPRDYEYHLPKKAVKAATRMAILSKLLDGEAVVIDDFVFTTPKTKEMTALLKSVKVGKKSKTTGDATVEHDVTLADGSVLIGTAGYDMNLYKSGRNIQGVKVLPVTEFNAFVVLKQKRLMLTESAFTLLLGLAPQLARAGAARAG